MRRGWAPAEFDVQGPDHFSAVHRSKDSGAGRRGWTRSRPLRNCTPGDFWGCLRGTDAHCKKIMFRLPLILLALALLATGCVQHVASAAKPTLVVRTEGSRSIAFYEPHLSYNNGHLLLSGAVYRQLGAFSTAQSHIEMSVFDATGRELLSNVIDFWPREISPRTSRWSPRANFSLQLDPLPMTAALIRLTAFDQPKVSRSFSDGNDDGPANSTVLRSE